MGVTYESPKLRFYYWQQAEGYPVEELKADDSIIPKIFGTAAEHFLYCLQATWGVTEAKQHVFALWMSFHPVTKDLLTTLPLSVDFNFDGTDLEVAERLAQHFVFSSHLQSKLPATNILAHRLFTRIPPISPAPHSTATTSCPQIQPDKLLGLANIFIQDVFTTVLFFKNKSAADRFTQTWQQFVEKNELHGICMKIIETNSQSLHRMMPGTSVFRLQSDNTRHPYALLKRYVDLSQVQVYHYNHQFQRIQESELPEDILTKLNFLNETFLPQFERNSASARNTHKRHRPT
jgi:hypothetical protein